MSRRISLAVAAACLLSAAPAAAQEFTLYGWNAAGEAVFDVRDPGSKLTYTGGTTELQVICAPAALATAAWDKGCRACQPEGCQGVTRVKARAALTSPDKKLAVTDKRACEPVAPGQKVCQRVLTFGKLGEVTYDEAEPRRKPALAVYFRPDSKAAVARFSDATADGVRYHSLVVVALEPAAPVLPAALDRTAVAAGMRALTDDVRQCLSAYKHAAGVVKIKVTIGGAGTLTGHELDAAQAGTPVDTCVQAAVPRARFPQFSGPPMTIAYPMSL